MKLYHFCPSHLLKSIKKRGLTKGHMPLLKLNSTELIGGVQWLTVEPDPSKQSWATRHVVSYDRTECRLTVEIPSRCEEHLVSAMDFIKRYPEADQRIITGYEGSDQWYVYLGLIPPVWISDVEFMKENGNG